MIKSGDNIERFSFFYSRRGVTKVFFVEGLKIKPVSNSRLNGTNRAKKVNNFQPLRTL